MKLGNRRKLNSRVSTAKRDFQRKTIHHRSFVLGKATQFRCQSRRFVTVKLRFVLMFLSLQCWLLTIGFFRR